jgi:vacuolar protein sorting-associated protein 26
MSQPDGPLRFAIAISAPKPFECPGIVPTGEPFNWSVTITVTRGNTFSHRGIDAEFTSEFYAKDCKPMKLSHVQNRLSDAGTINATGTFNFATCLVPPHMQTYRGSLFRVQHWIRISVKKTIGSVTYHEEVTSFEITPMARAIDALCVRIAIADNIRIDLMVNRRKYDIADVICGAAHFLLVSLKIKTFTVALVAQEISEVTGKTQKCANVLQTWDMVDGAPVKGEIVPFRLYLAPLALCPSCARAEGGYTVAHFLHFSFVTTNGGKYFKDLQIVIVKWPTLPFEFEEESSSE